VQTTSAGGLTNTTTYDSQGRIASETDAQGNTTMYHWGVDGTAQAGLLVAIEHPTYRQSWTYDANGQIASITEHYDGQTRTSHLHHDALGQRLGSTDALGRSTIHSYDALGRTIQSTDAAGDTTRYHYNAHDQLTALVDANGNEHTFEYDQAGQLIEEKRPLGGSTRYQYDAAGQLVQRVDAAGNTRQWHYDAAGRVIREEHQGSSGQSEQSTTYQHDADGVLLGYEQKGGAGKIISAASYTLDAQGRSTQSQIRYGALEGSAQIMNITTGQSYNADGQITSQSWPDASASAWHYSQGRLARVELPDQTEIRYGDWQDGIARRIQMPGVEKTIALDGLLRPASITVRSSGSGAPQALASRQYQYDLAGKITRIGSDLGQSDYQYDALARLTQTRPGQSLQALGLPAQEWGYDAVHNRTRSSHAAGAWDYDADNRLIQYPQRGAFAPDSEQALSTQVQHTAHGHIAREENSQAQTSREYNSAERRIRYTHTPRDGSAASTEARYRYDPFGRRIGKTVTVGTSSSAVYYVYSEGALMAELDAQGRMTKAYGFHPEAMQQGLWSTEPLWQAEVANASLADKGTSYHYLHTDHLGTPVLATDKTGAVTWKAVADAFGETRVLPQSRITMNLRFPGQYFDAESGLHYNLHRDYNPQTGRYLQSDPIGLNGGINLFAYAAQNPIEFIDPNGKNPAVAAAVAAVGRLIVAGLRNIPRGKGNAQNPPVPPPAIPIPPIPQPSQNPPQRKAKDFDHNPGEDCDGNCNPCSPPVGTVCYRGPDTTHDHAGLRPHYHLWQMGQSPDCMCRWQYLGGQLRVGVVATPPAGIPSCPFN